MYLKKILNGYICKYCSGNLYIEKYIDDESFSYRLYKAIIFCKSCFDPIWICAYSKEDFENDKNKALKQRAIKHDNINKI